DSSEDFELPSRQTAQLRATVEYLAQESLEHVGQIRHDIATDPPLARHGAAEALGNELHGGVLPKHSAYAQLKRADDVDSLAARRHDDNANGSLRSQQLTENLDPGTLRERQLEKKRVGPQLSDEPDRLAPVGRFADDKEVRIVLEKAAQTVAHDGMSVRD